MPTRDTPRKPRCPRGPGSDRCTARDRRVRSEEVRMRCRGGRHGPGRAAGALQGTRRPQGQRACAPPSTMTTCWLLETRSPAPPTETGLGTDRTAGWPAPPPRAQCHGHTRSHTVTRCRCPGHSGHRRSQGTDHAHTGLKHSPTTGRGTVTPTGQGTRKGATQLYSHVRGCRTLTPPIKGSICK